MPNVSVVSLSVVCYFLLPTMITFKYITVQQKDITNIFSFDRVRRHLFYLEGDTELACFHVK